MKFENISGKQRSRRSKVNSHAPAIVESLEVRSLLTVLSPTGVVNSATPTITWEAVDNATSYDLWVSDREQMEVMFIRNNITTTHFTPTTPLNLGKARAWVRANFANAPSSSWSSPTDFIVQVAPTLTGPLNAQLPSAPHKLNDTQPTVTWTTPPGASRFQIFLSDQTNLTGQTFIVPNLTPVLDAGGFAFFDENQQIVREEKTSFELPEALPMGSYRVFIRSRDDGGHWSDWSAPLNFEVAPQVTITRPTGPSFENPPLLEWQAVPGATSYDVFVAKAATPKSPLYFLGIQTGTSYQIPKPLAAGDYVFMVRARRNQQVIEINLTGVPTSGSYQISLTTFGEDAKTQQTALIGYDATAAQIKTAIVALAGFENVNVVSTGVTPNQNFLIQMPLPDGRVRVNVVGSISPGKLTFSTKDVAEVLGIWSAPARFSTLRNPVITGPAGIETAVPNERLVTDVRPIVEWTPIDKAARYDIWVVKANAKSPFLVTTASSNFYQFQQDIEPGKYMVWVRAVSTTGNKTRWSSPFSFTATGGVPVITSPKAGQNVFPIPNINWTAVPDAKSYNIHIAWLGEDFTYIQTTGIALTTFAPADPLPAGTYRVWVQAVKSDGTKLRWSASVDFSVASSELEKPLAEIPELLAVLLPSAQNVHAEAVAEPAARQALNSESQYAPPIVDGRDAESIAMLSGALLAPPMGLDSEGIIEQLAEQCTVAEWWMPSGTEA